MLSSLNVKLQESTLFFKQWLRDPRAMGSIIPSSAALARAIAGAVVWQPGQTVVELGGGTGAITQGLIASGLPREALLVIELDPDLCAYLREQLPGVRVLQGDATRLREVLDREGVADVSTVVSGLPMLNMPFEFQRAIVDQALQAAAPHGPMLQYTYSPRPPVPTDKLGIEATRIRYVVWNVPPATVWKYRRATDARS